LSDSRDYRLALHCSASHQHPVESIIHDRTPLQLSLSAPLDTNTALLPYGHNCIHTCSHALVLWPTPVAVAVQHAKQGLADHQSHQMWGQSTFLRINPPAGHFHGKEHTPYRSLEGCADTTHCTTCHQVPDVPVVCVGPPVACYIHLLLEPVAAACGACRIRRLSSNQAWRSHSVCSYVQLGQCLCRRLHAQTLCM
jgi:hypothetical protein